MARNVPEGIAGESAIRTLWTGISNKFKSLKTSNLTNDGDGTSAFATENYVESHSGKIDSIQVSGTPQEITNKVVNITKEASTSTSGLMSNSDKTKLNGIASGAEVNQNAFSNVKVGSTTIVADSKTDTIELVAGTNITLTPDATNDKVTINANELPSTSGVSDGAFLRKTSMGIAWQTLSQAENMSF